MRLSEDQLIDRCNEVMEKIATVIEHESALLNESEDVAHLMLNVAECLASSMISSVLCNYETPPTKAEIHKLIDGVCAYINKTTLEIMEGRHPAVHKHLVNLCDGKMQ